MNCAIRGVLLVLCLALFFVSNAHAVSVYVMDSGDPTNVSLVTTALTNAGHSVTNGLAWHLQDAGNNDYSNDHRRYWLLTKKKSALVGKPEIVSLRPL